MILLIDNYDSFSYNLYQMLGEMEPDIEVVRNDAITAEEVLQKQPGAIIISPGPGKPSDAGICEEVVKICAGRIPILGVCLGHQAICEAFGAMIVHARELKHGKQSVTRLNRWSLLFKGLPEKIKVARYHSLAVRPDTLPRALRVSAVAEDGEIMAVEHERAPIFGLQFHPESIMTPEGRTILKNFLAIADSFPRAVKDKVNIKEVQPFNPPVLKRESLKAPEEKAAKENKGEAEVETRSSDKRESQNAVVNEAIVKLVNGEKLSVEMLKAALEETMSGRASQVSIASLLTALSTRGTTLEEMAACAETVGKHVVSLKHPYEALEISKVGRNRTNIFNISSAVSIILAAAGIKVTGHGSSDMFGGCSEADCLEKLGVNIMLKPEQMSGILEKTNMAFMLDQIYLKPVEHVEAVRKVLPMSTIFNILEPLISPSRPARMLAGVDRGDMRLPVIHFLEMIGVKRVMSVFGQDGMMGISLNAPTDIVELKDGQYTDYIIRPEDFGMERCEAKELEAVSPEENAAVLKAVFSGEKGARRNVIVLNSAAALHLARDISMEEGIRAAEDILDSGRAKDKLEELVRETNEGAGR